MNKNLKKGMVPYVFLVLMMLGIYYFVGILNQKVNLLTYDALLNEMGSDRVEEIVVTPRTRAGVYEISGKIVGYKKNEYFFVRVHLTDTIIKEISTFSE